jgi:hypothetical protein
VKKGKNRWMIIDGSQEESRDKGFTKTIVKIEKECEKNASPL